ncbi:MAG: hypothetical protein AB1351_05095 [Thermoproteota archaeon]
MSNIEPFLFRFRKECVSPRRLSFQPETIYDSKSDMMLVKEEGQYIPAIDSLSQRGLGTKKCDIEKGEDQKDSLMW